MPTRAQAKYSRVRDPEETEFKQLIQRDPDICNNCFRLTHVSEERNYGVDTYRDGNESKIWLKEVDLPNRKWPKHENTEFTLADDMTGGSYRGCECGAHHTTVRPVSKPVAMDHLERLLDRLEDKDFVVDRNLARHIAWQYFSDPDRQGKQDETFADIVEVVI